MKKFALILIFICVFLVGCTKPKPVYSISVDLEYQAFEISANIVKSQDGSYQFEITKPAYLSSAEIILKDNKFNVSVLGFEYVDEKIDMLNAFSPFITDALNCVVNGDFDDINFPDMQYGDSTIKNTRTEDGMIIKLSVPELDLELNLKAEEIK